MRKHGSLGTLFWIAFAACVAHTAQAEPLDLDNGRARWIEVRFEVSPQDQPGSLDRTWSTPRRAYLEPTQRIDPTSADPLAPTLLQIRIPADEIEEHLRSTGTDTVEGSFSEFVWTLDPGSGHVRQAGLTGRVREEIRLGPFRSSAQIEIRVEMTTEAGGGFEPGSGILGIPTHRFCTPEQRQDECVGVAPVRFDPKRGYVNAVGSVVARTPIAEVRAFSPLGEVEFLEKSVRGTDSRVSGTSQSEALCSDPFNGPCAAVLGGES